MMKPLVVAAAAVFTVSPALAAPTLNTVSVYADKYVDVAGGFYGDVVYGTTFSSAPPTGTYSTLAQATPAERAALTQQAKDLSAFYKGLPGTPFSVGYTGPGITSFDWTLTGIVGDNVVNLTPAQIGDIETLLRVNPVGITQLIFNIPGMDVDAALFELMLPSGLTSDKVLFNFYEATEVGGTGKTIHGSILAPYAHVSISGLTVDGVVISDQFSAANVNVLGQGFNFGPPPAVPEPATWALLILGFGVVGHAMRRRRSIAKPALAA